MSAQAATYDPTGIQSDVDKSTVLGGGWSIIYVGIWDQTNVDIASIFAQANDKVMLASALVGSNAFDLLASIETSIYAPLQTSRNQTIQSNGAEWYKNGFSMGFAALGDTISQGSADTGGGANSDMRMSWHTNITGGQNSNDPANTISYGYRSGDNFLNGGSNWERFVLTNNVTPIPLPAALPLLLVALGGLGIAARRRKSA